MCAIFLCYQISHIITNKSSSMKKNKNPTIPKSNLFNFGIKSSKVQERSNSIKHAVSEKTSQIKKNREELLKRNLQVSSKPYGNQIKKLNDSNSNESIKNVQIFIQQTKQKIHVKKLIHSKRVQANYQPYSNSITKKRIIQLNSINSLKNATDNILDMFNQKNIIQQNNNNQMIQLQNNLPKVITCNCKKSKCLKLYCQCFSKGNFCNQSCSCVHCCNNLANQQQRKHAKLVLSIKNSSYSRNNISQKIDQSKKTITKGCNCKKSGCNKKYCECYSQGQKCSSSCNCKQCKNGISKNKQEVIIVNGYQAYQDSNVLKFQQLYNPNTMSMRNQNSKIFNRKEENNLNYTLNFHDIITQKDEEMNQ